MPASTLAYTRALLKARKSHAGADRPAISTCWMRPSRWSPLSGAATILCVFNLGDDGAEAGACRGPATALDLGTGGASAGRTAS